MLYLTDESDFFSGISHRHQLSKFQKLWGQLDFGRVFSVVFAWFAISESIPYAGRYLLRGSGDRLSLCKGCIEKNGRLDVSYTDRGYGIYHRQYSGRRKGRLLWEGRAVWWATDQFCTILEATNALGKRIYPGIWQIRSAAGTADGKAGEFYLLRYVNGKYSRNFTDQSRFLYQSVGGGARIILL